MKLFFGEIFPEIKINDEEQNHITKVLRMKAGDEIFVTDGRGNLAKGNLVFEGKKVSLEATEVKENLPDFPIRLHIAIAPTKNIDRIEFFVEKATEMAVSEITIIQTEKTERKNLNIEKIRKQAVSASKQSQRFHFPIVNDNVKFSEFISNLKSENTYVAHCHENLERTILNEIPLSENLTILIGPEGDFSEKEIAMLAEKGIKAVSFGEQRLRTETAGIFAAAWVYSKMF